MVVGGAATIVALLCLAWVREIVGGFLGTFGVDAHSTGVKTTTIVVATILMYCLDFSINTGRSFFFFFFLERAFLVLSVSFLTGLLQYRQAFALSSSTMLQPISKNRRMLGRAGLQAWAIFWDIYLAILICPRSFRSLETRNSKSFV